MSGKKSIPTPEKDFQRLSTTPHAYVEIFHMSLDMICIADINTTHFLKVNPAFTRTLGYAEPDLLNRSFLEFIHPDDIDPTRAVVEKELKAGKKVLNFKNRYRCADGSYKWLEWVSHPMPERGITFAIAHDITKTQEIEAQLREREAFIQAVMDNLPIGIAVNSVDPGVRFEYMNDNFPKFYRTTREAITAAPDSFWDAVYESPKFREKMRHQVLADCATGDPEKMVWEDVPIVRKGSPTRYITARNTPVPDKGLMISTVWDVTRQKNAETDLNEIRRLLEETQAITRLGGWEFDVRTQRLVWTREVFRIHGLEELSNPVDLENAVKFYEPANVMVMREAFQAALEHGIPYDLELPLTRADGRQIWVRTMGQPHTSGGRVVRISGNIQDITEKKQADREREALQAQLLQAQKMESVGRLAGGVAHDFNNMLGVIIGHTEIALDQIAPDHPVHLALDEIQKAARRSVDLTRQLLAFARKQAAVPKILDLNATVAGMLKILHRLIGENIELVWRPGENLWPVRIDPGQIDQILANLCINARDAIAGPGRIIIETTNKVLEAPDCTGLPDVVPGAYLRLTVRDNGCGMDPPVLSQLFDPFFTTKGPGKGTGLGLSTVYGIVKQNLGHVTVESTPGRGTIFHLYFPRHEGPEKAGRATDPAPDTGPRTGDETVLVVEDEPAILELCTRMLKRLGYRVLGTSSPREAIAMAKAHPGQIHLLLSDVIMPEMNGRELARRLSEDHPGLKRLYMSGYTADVIAVHGVLEPGVHFIQKPFAVNALAESVRNVLDAPSG